MRRVLLAGMFVLALFAMLCAGFVLGVVFTPTLGRFGNVFGQVVQRAGIIIEPGARAGIRIPRIEQQLAVRPGTQIVEVIPGSPADQAGLKAGDILVSLNGKPIDNQADLAGQIANFKPGDSITLGVQQPGGARREVSLQLGDNPQKKGTAWLGIRYRPLAQILRQGLMPQFPQGGKNDNLPPGLQPHDFNFGPGSRQPGALIQEVIPDSPADKAGLKPGQVIQAVNGSSLKTSTDLAAVIAKQKPGDTLTLTVIDPATGSSQSREVMVKLGENPDQPGAAWLGIRFIYLNANPNSEPSPGG